MKEKLFVTRCSEVNEKTVYHENVATFTCLIVYILILELSDFLFYLEKSLTLMNSDFLEKNESTYLKGILFCEFKHRTMQHFLELKSINVLLQLECALGRKILHHAPSCVLFCQK